MTSYHIATLADVSNQVVSVKFVALINTLAYRSIYFSNLSIDHQYYRKIVRVQSIVIRSNHGSFLGILQEC